MMTWSELQAVGKDLRSRFQHLWIFLRADERQIRLRELEKAMASAHFWDSQENSKRVIGESQSIKKCLRNLQQFQVQFIDLETFIELLEEQQLPEDSPEFSEIEALAMQLQREMGELELQSFLSGPLDDHNAIITIHSGAGGTEACDWADLLLRMYLRWAERRGFQTEIQEIQPGEEAGISRATFRLLGDYAYGYAKAERGVHRLVRISPFDANKRRHTSFGSVDVIAEIEDDVAVDIDEEELRIDTYRSSGKGGQHVNKTDSAVRITHLPSGIVVTCQNERSQIKNRATAMRVLRARLFEKMQDEKRSAMEKFYGEKGEIGWGNQIRSYVFQPYQLVKDLRTGTENGNVQQVMDGELDPFIHAWLRAGCPSSRHG